MTDLQATLGLILRRERKSRRLTLRELADRAGVSLVYLGEIERGKKYPSALVVERLAAALELDVSDLLELVVAELRAAPAGGYPAPAPTPANHPRAAALGFALPGRAAPGGGYPAQPAPRPGSRTVGRRETALLLWPGPQRNRRTSIA